MRKLFLIIFSMQIYNVLMAQKSNITYAIILKGGHVMDPKNNIDEVMDIAINSKGKIAS